MAAATTFCVRGTAHGQCEEQFLQAADASAASEFGYAVRMSGDVAVIGARNDPELGANAGAAYVYRFDGFTWTEEAKLLASDGAPGDSFGSTVDVSGDVVVVGAFLNDDDGSNSGSAYIFRFDGTTWVEEQKLLASDASANDRFGRGVAVDADLVAVGAYQDDDEGSNSGSVYLYRYAAGTWSLEQKLTAADGAANDWFGRRLALDGSYLVVSSYQDDDNGATSGSAYVYRLVGSTWVEDAKLIASDGAAGDRFGRSVDIDNGVVTIGANQDDDNGSNSGSMYVYELQEAAWVEVAKLVPADGNSGDRFGRDHDLQGDALVVGAYLDDDLGNDTGSAYVYLRVDDVWTPTAHLFATDAAEQDEFGYAVATDGTQFLTGARLHDLSAVDAGSIYVNDLSVFDDCNLNGLDDDCEIFHGFAIDDDENGIPDDCLPIFGDLNADGFVDSADLLILLAAWGPCPAPPDDCPADLNEDGTVNVADVILLLAAFGAPPEVANPCRHFLSHTVKQEIGNEAWQSLDEEVRDAMRLVGRYRIHNHPDGNAGPPLYGLRLDELFDVTGGHDVFTFDFDAEGAKMWLDYDGTSIRIYGTAFGGRDAGSDYDADHVSWVEIDFTYSTVGRTSDGEGLEVTTADFTNSGTITWLETGEVIDLFDFSGSHSYTFRNATGHRGEEGLSGWGWVDHHAPGTHVYSSDWLFTCEYRSRASGNMGLLD